MLNHVPLIICDDANSDETEYILKAFFGQCIYLTVVKITYLETT